LNIKLYLSKNEKVYYKLKTRKASNSVNKKDVYFNPNVKPRTPATNKRRLELTPNVNTPTPTSATNKRRLDLTPNVNTPTPTSATKKRRLDSTPIVKTPTSQITKLNNKTPNVKPPILKVNGETDPFHINVKKAEKLKIKKISNKNTPNGQLSLNSKMEHKISKPTAQEKHAKAKKKLESMNATNPGILAQFHPSLQFIPAWWHEPTKKIRAGKIRCAECNYQRTDSKPTIYSMIKLQKAARETIPRGEEGFTPRTQFPFFAEHPMREGHEHICTRKQVTEKKRRNDVNMDGKKLKQIGLFDFGFGKKEKN